MIYTSGTNRILTINEADNTKVGWAADNTTSNGKLVFSDADVNWEHNTATYNTMVNLSNVAKMSNPYYIMNYDTGAGTPLGISGNNYVFVSGLGGVCLWPTSNTWITQGTSSIDSSRVYIYEANTTYRPTQNSTLYIYAYKAKFSVVTGYGSSATYSFKSPAMPEGADPPTSRSEMTFSYSPSPILSVSQTIPESFSPVTNDTYWTGSVTVYVFYVPWGSSYPKLYSGNTVSCKIYRDGQICTNTGSSFTTILPTSSGTVVFFFTLANSISGYTFKTGRFYGDTTTSRSTGYAGTATVTANETGSASITQTS